MGSSTFFKSSSVSNFLFFSFFLHFKLLIFCDSSQILQTKWLTSKMRVLLRNVKRKYSVLSLLSLTLLWPWWESLCLQEDVVKNLVQNHLTWTHQKQGSSWKAVVAGTNWARQECTVPGILKVHHRHFNFIQQVLLSLGTSELTLKIQNIQLPRAGPAWADIVYYFRMEMVHQIFCMYKPRPMCVLLLLFYCYVIFNKILIKVQQYTFLVVST